MKEKFTIKTKTPEIIHFSFYKWGGFQVKFLYLKILVFVAILTLPSAVFQSCQKDNDMTPGSPIDSLGMSGELKNFINTDLSTWTIESEGLLDAEGNTIYTVSASIPSGTNLGSMPDIDVKLNLYDGAIGGEKLSNAFAAANIRLKDGRILFDIRGPLTPESELIISANTLERGSVGNGSGKLEVSSDNLGILSPLMASYLYFRGLGLSPEGRSKLPLLVYPEGVDVTALKASETFEVDYTIMNTNAEKLAATKLAVKNFMIASGYPMMESNGTTPTKWAEYINLLDNSDFQALASDAHQLAHFYSIFDGSSWAEDDFQFVTQFNYDGTKLPATHKNANHLNRGYELVWDSTRAVVRQEGNATTRTELNDDGQPVTRIYFDDKPLGSGLPSVYRRSKLGDIKEVLYGHEIKHGRPYSARFVESSIAEEEFAVVAGVIDRIFNPKPPVTSVDYIIAERMIIFLASSGANGKFGAADNPRVATTNGSRPWQGGLITDGNLSFRSRIQYKLAGVLQPEGGFVTVAAKHAVNRWTDGEVQWQVGQPYTYTMLDDMYAKIKFPEEALKQIADMFGLMATPPN